MKNLNRSAVALGLIASLVACGSDSFTPTQETVAGSYSATTFTAASGAGTLDLLGLGASVTVTLAADGTTTGRLFVPGGGEGGEDLDEDLTGTWTLDGSTVTFSQTADTFIRDAAFTAGRDRLTGEGTFDGQTIRLVLTKTG
ncbi:MAG: hypothetical protein ACRDGJ_01135 [Candidatus Limnocylindria bacterium]